MARAPLCACRLSLLALRRSSSKGVAYSTAYSTRPTLLLCHADPFVGLPEDGRVWPSRLEFWAPGSEALLLEVDEQFFLQSYAPEAAQQTDARFRLMRAGLHGLPAALVLTCGVDSLLGRGPSIC